MTSNQNDYLERLSELEVKSAFQDDLLNTLNDVIARQELEIQKLWEANKYLKASFDSMKQSDTDKTDMEPPPHY